MYRKKRCKKRCLAALLSAIVVMGSIVVNMPRVEVHAAEVTQEIPTSYSSVAEGYTPEVRNQGSFGNCWTYAATASVEISMIKNNVVSADEVDLSEAHLIYYICRPVADPLGGTDVDYTGVLGDTVYDMFHNGGEIGYTAATLLGWMGPVAEENFYDYDYLYANHNEPAQLEGLDDVAHAYGNREAIVTETAQIPLYDRDEVKRLIMDYGSIGVSYNASTSNFDYTHSAQYAANYLPANHAVVIVGWDDEFSRENFKSTPPGDGAWLVRNSWGSGHGIAGYFWLSYYDVTLSAGGRVYRAVAPDKYDNNYRYDRTGNDVGYVNGVEKGSIEAANVFKIQGEKEILKAVQFGTQWDNLNYSIQVYKNPTDAKDPTTGEALLETPIRGTEKHAGNYTVDLGEKIVLEKGDVIAVSVTYTSDNPKVCPAAQTGHIGVCRVGESVYRVNQGAWQDCGEEGGQNFLIRAFTSNVTEVSETHQHEWAEEWSINDEAHWHDCEGSNCCTLDEGNGYALHEGGVANCKDRAVCDDCGNEYGLRDASAHVGGKIRRNVRAATTTMTGYTGDVCCSGCNLILEEGEEIPMLDKDSENSGFKSVPNLEYTFNSLNGEAISSKAEGKPKVIMFYGAGCGGCINTLENITERKIDGVDICAVEVNQSSKEKIFELKDTLGVGKDDIHFCYDSEAAEASQARIAYEKAFNGMTYSSLPVLCYIDENNQITQVTSGEQTYNQVKSNLALYCNLMTKNLDLPNPSDMSLTTLDGEEFTLAADGKPKVIIFFSVCANAIDTFANMTSGTIPGVDVYAIDLLSGDDENTKWFMEQYMYNVKGIKVARSQDAILEMVKYAEAANEAENIIYPIICYIDAENQLQQVTFGVSSLDEIKLNLSANCGFTGEEVPDPSATLELQKPDKTTYLKGETLNLEGATVAINGGVAVPVDSTMVSGFDSEKEGIVTVKVNYQNMETSFQVLIIEQPELEATKGMRLAEVTFPENSYGTYTWTNPSEELRKAGEQTYDAAFVPNDKEKYSILENVEIKLNVKEVVVPPEPEPAPEIIDKAALESAIAATEALTETDYTADSWSALQTALEAATVLNGKEDVSQKEVTAAAEALVAAMKALEKAPTTELPKAGWVEDENGWWYRYADGGYPKNRWELIDGKWYWFGVDGYMKTGWLRQGTTWYYLTASGAMATGWLQQGTTWYYLNASGAMATGWKQIGGIWYYLNTNGAMATGWKQIGGIWYYLNTNGAMATGWKQIGGTWYYLKSDGAMAVGKLKIDNRMNSFASSGAWLGYI